MSARERRFKFTPGETVLCFEPDPTKARVLYEAKILDTTYYSDSTGRNQPGYHIHFLRWNHSWDRVVRECYILKNSESNNLLMRQLADVARKVRKNRTRRTRIGEVLSQAFNGKPPQFESDSEDSEDSEEENTTDTGDTESGLDSESSEESDNQSEEQVKEKKLHPLVTLEIPDNLKAVLDRDYFTINHDKKLVKLPVEINVVTVLESFVKTFMLDFWSPAFDRSQFCRTAPKIAIERILPMCKEFVDGLRISFDFVLPLILLYSVEKEQFTRITNMYKHKSPAKSKIPTDDSLIQSPRSRSAAAHSLTMDESAPKIPKLSPNIIDDDDDKEVTFLRREKAPRRVLRSSAANESQKRTESDSSKHEQKSDSFSESRSVRERRCSDRRADKSGECMSRAVKSRRMSDRIDTSTLKRRALRNYRKSSEESNESDYSKAETVQSEPVKTNNHKNDSHADRPPPLLIPCNISSGRQNGNGSGEKGGEKGAPGSTDSLGESGREEILENILDWQMLPAEVQCRLPTPPSLLYGAQHLLRLFVKMPELLSRMEIDENKMGVLLKLLQQFLIYLSEHTVELFPDSAYIPAADA